MTFQFIIEYIDPSEDPSECLPFYFDYSDEAYDLLCDGIIRRKRIRAKNGEQAIEIFQQKYPELEVIGWR